MAEPSAFDYTTAAAGTAWPSLSLPPISRLTLALYCGASGDHNPLHVDQDFARDAGLGDVIAHGMLVMAYMSRTVTQVVPQSALLSFNTRFQAMTRVGDQITCTGEITARETSADGRSCIRLALRATDQKGEVKTQGEALIALPG